MKKVFHTQKLKIKSKPNITPSELKNAQKLHDEKVEECQEKLVHNIMTMH